MVEEILANKNAVYSLIKLRDYDNYTFTHSVNVCVLSILTGSLLGYNRMQLENLGLGAMLHDIGKVLIDSRIMNKPAKLSVTEYEVVKKHTIFGYKLLKSKIATSFLPAHIALQHHEREDGSGYPRGLTAKRIHRYAKIVAVADVFDAMTTDRIYQKAVIPQVSLEKIKKDQGIKFDKRITENFMRVIAPYPIGSILVLNNEQRVIVSQVTREKCIVKCISGTNAGEKYDLFQRPELAVVKYFR